MSRCLMEGCLKPPIKNGWCREHNRGKKPCSVKGCERLVRAHGLCGPHWVRQRDGKPLEGGSLRPRAKFLIGDEVLREDYKTQTIEQMAGKYGVKFETVRQRLVKLRLLDCAVLTKESHRYVGALLSITEQLTKNMEYLDLLREACHEWLSYEGRYELGPRTEDVDVLYKVEVESADGLRTEKRKKNLTELLQTLEVDPDGNRISEVTKSEYRHADPRELILKTSQEVRQTMSTCAELALQLVDAKSMMSFRESILEEIGKVDEDTKERIAQAIRRRVLLQGAFGGFESMVAPG